MTKTPNMRQMVPDAEALHSMGIQINLPSPVQQFDDVHVDLAKYPGVYARFLDLTGSEKHPSYGNQTGEEAVRETLQNKELLSSLTGEERQTAVDGIVHDYSELAKRKLTEEFPVLLQEIDDQKNQSNQ